MIIKDVVQPIPIVRIALNKASSSAYMRKHVHSASNITQIPSASISALQKGLIYAKNKALNIYSDASRFFGVDSADNVIKQLENHLKLINLKCEENGILKIFPKRCFFSADSQRTIDCAWKKIWKKDKGRQFDELCKKPARLTFYGKFFGQYKREGTHTIGLVYMPETKTLVCLDSLPNSIDGVKKYQDILSKQIFNSPNGEIQNIIFSNKPQQTLNEYTCNNWTISNLETVQKALKEGKNINNTDDVNMLLEDDINKILKEQYEYVLKNN